MQTYIVTGREASFMPGAILGLTGEQISRRAHAVRLIESTGDFEVVAPDNLEFDSADLADDRDPVLCTGKVNFKLGETVVVVHASPVNKMLFDVVAPEGSPGATDAISAVAATRATGRRINDNRQADAKAENAARAAKKETAKKRAAPKPTAKNTAKPPAGLAQDEKPAS